MKMYGTLKTRLYVDLKMINSSILETSQLEFVLNKRREVSQY